MALDSAVRTFCNILTSTNAPPRVAVVIWASDIGTNTVEFVLTGQTSVGVVTDLGLSSDMSAVYSVVHQRSLNVMLGGTDMASGINQGTAVLTGSNVRSYAKKFIVLMTDGQWNTGTDPVAAAATAQAQNITIHCISYLKNADQTTCQTNRHDVFACLDRAAACCRSS